MALGRGPSSKYRHSATPTFTYVYIRFHVGCAHQSYRRLLHEDDLRRCFRNSASVTYVSTLPSTSSFCVCLVPYVHLAVSALHLILRAKSQHICFKCARMALRATFSCERGLRRFAMEPPFWNYSSPSGLLLTFSLVGYCLH